ncbi:MAG: peptidoglycan editing factor PgeF [candidate division WOR-3 bacterium]|nr:peptidoglycan editing factor PgeF [candidate division WOR-3 bacterium]
MNKDTLDKVWRFEENNNLKFFRLVFEKPELENLLCLFFTRQSSSNYLNLGINRIVTLYQTHSDVIWYVNQDFADSPALLGDGLFTDQINTFIGVKVADCLPIYFFSPEKKIIGIVHSGWRGTLKEIGPKMAKTLLVRFNLQPEQIYYAFGPSIGVCCYEIGPEVATLFDEFCQKRNISNSIVHRDNKVYLDLKQVNHTLLRQLGLISIADIGMCSYCQKDLFYSARREKNAGRNLALIGYRK